MGPENLLFVSDDAVEAVLHKAIEHLPTGNVANLCLIGSRLSTLENNLAPRETVNVQALLALPIRRVFRITSVRISPLRQAPQRNTSPFSRFRHHALPSSASDQAWK